MTTTHRRLSPRRARRSLGLALPLLAVLIPATGPAGAAGPQAMEPGAAHRRLDFLVGEWDVRARAHTGDTVHESIHRTQVAWLPGGVWLEERTDALGTPGGPMFGSARLAWDAQAGEYVRHWVDNQSVVLLPQRGRFVADDTLEFRGSFAWTDGTTYHQRLVIERLQEGGWRQTGYMGLDPAALRLNHEGTAVRAPRPAAPAAGAHPIPAWLEEHMRFQTQGSGRWITDNAAYKSDDEPFDAYGVEWKWGIGKMSLTGRLFGLIDGEEQGTFWEFRTAWDPGQARALAYQFGGNGVFGVGPMEPAGEGRTRLLQVFHALDGSSFSVGHDSIETPDNTHITQSFDVLADGSWKARRTYTWHLETP